MISRIRRRLGSLLRRRSADHKVRWFGADTEREAELALSARAGRILSVSTGKQALVIGSGDSFEQNLCASLRRRGLSFYQVSLEEIQNLKDEQLEAVAVTLCAYKDVRRQTAAARMVAEHGVLGPLPFEQASGLDASRQIFHQLDEYGTTDFVSPVLLSEISPYDIYQESLQYFQQKCGLRDYLDLYQLLKSIVDNGVAGDIAEFGSFRGHSGWLIARTLEALGSSKKVYLFDTFESFPVESYGVDHFWSETHPVDYESVRAKFADRPAVTLVKGDFTQTLSGSGIGALALAYIDCDSYRATRFLLETLPVDHISSGGAMVCEDYGHPALLGNRVAVHQVCDDMAGWFRYFSQFSGLYIMIKMDKV